MLRQPGPHGNHLTGRGHRIARLPVATPGSLGVNDPASLLASGRGPTPLRMLQDLILGATGGMGKAYRPFEAAIAITRFNFGWIRTKDKVTRKTLTSKQLALSKPLGGQSKDDGVLFYLSASSVATEMLQGIYTAAAEQKLRPSFITAALFTEIAWTNYQPGKLDTYEFIGMDRFLKEVPEMIVDGCLPKDLQTKFKRTKTIDQNEANESNRRAEFKSMPVLVRSFAALLAHRRHLMKPAIPSNVAPLRADGEPDLTEDQLDYWNYVYYNTSPSHFAKHIVKEGKDLPTRKIQGPTEKNIATGNAQRMTYIKRLVEWAGMADPTDPSSMKIKLEGLDEMMMMKK